MGLTGFLKIDNIDGESRAAGHADEIDVHGLHWRVQKTKPSQRHSGRSSSRAQVDSLTCNKQTDASSAYLALACMQGKSYPSAVLTVAKDSSNAPFDYLVITMENVEITRFEMLNDGSDPDDQVVGEEVSLTFEKVTYKYTVQADDHSGGTEHEIEYDIKAGV